MISTKKINVLNVNIRLLAKKMKLLTTANDKKTIFV